MITNARQRKTLRLDVHCAIFRSAWQGRVKSNYVSWPLPDCPHDGWWQTPGEAVQLQTCAVCSNAGWKNRVSLSWGDREQEWRRVRKRNLTTSVFCTLKRVYRYNTSQHSNSDRKRWVHVSQFLRWIYYNFTKTNTHPFPYTFKYHQRKRYLNLNHIFLKIKDLSWSF